MIEEAGLYIATDGECCTICGDELDAYVHLPESDDVVLCVCIPCALGNG